MFITSSEPGTLGLPSGTKVRLGGDVEPEAHDDEDTDSYNNNIDGLRSGISIVSAKVPADHRKK